MKTKIKLVAVFFFILLPITQSITAQTPNKTYTIQQDDWLSKIAQKNYGNPHMYYRIIAGTK